MEWGNRGFLWYIDRGVRLVSLQSLKADNYFLIKFTTQNDNDEVAYSLLENKNKAFKIKIMNEISHNMKRLITTYIYTLYAIPFSVQSKQIFEPHSWYSKPRDYRSQVLQKTPPSFAISWCCHMNYVNTSITILYQNSAQYTMMTQ